MGSVWRFGLGLPVQTKLVKEVLMEAYIHLSSARLHLIYEARQADVLQSQITFLVGLPKSMMSGKFWLNPR